MNRRATDPESADHSARRGLDPEVRAIERRTIVLPRWSLHVIYILFAVFSVVAFISGLPSLDFASPAGYRPFWAAALFLGSLGALVGYVRERGVWASVERYSLAVLMAFVAAYIYAIAVPALEGDQARQGNAVLLVVAIVLPFARWVELSFTKGQRPPKTKATTP